MLSSLIVSPAARLGVAAQNALEVARFGGLATGEVASPYAVMAHRPVYRLRRYFPDEASGPPVLLVPPLMLATDIYDVSPSSTAVGVLREHGSDPWVVDFGAPEHEEGGLQRNLTDHVLAVSDAVERVADATGRDVHLGGYSQGGMFCYQAAAYRRSARLASLITFGSPADTSGALPFGIPEALAGAGAGLAAELFGGQAVPAWASRMGFRLLDPVKSVRQRIDFLLQLHDREALLPRERQRRFLMADGWVAWPGPALADFMRQFVVHNRMLTGGFVIEDRLVTLADISCPVLTFVGEVDEIAPAAMVRAVAQAAPRAEVYESSLAAGHFGLVVGTVASQTTWPTASAWAHWRDGEAEPPEHIRRVSDDGGVGPPGAGAGLGARVGHGVGLAMGVGVGITRSAVHTAGNTMHGVRELTEEAGRQLPRLARLEGVRPRTRISLGLLLDEHAARAPEQVLFLFEDRAYTQSAVKARVDNVVRGLISVGVRPGEHIGVLMRTRPSALAVVAALNRLGAVAVLMRPDGPVAREADIGQVSRVVADPELAHLAVGHTPGAVLVLGGGAQSRDLGAEIVDLERIDPEAVVLPRWYVPNPGRAGDLAFIVFTGERERTRPNRITHGRWVLSAFGTASSAALSPADTVYSLTPLYHPSGLLMSIGGAIAGGARMALARAFDPTTFWDEVRRYGVTVASYTWAMLGELVEAPPDPRERHHPVRLFIGSGMPRGLWRRVLERFAPAGVLEFYASTEGEAVLANLSGSKLGAKGRPLPGSAEVRLAAYDAEAGRISEGRGGFARVCETDEVGMLLARTRTPTSASSEAPLRSVFAREDAWLATGDLFRRDADGDHWLIDHVPALIPTAHGPVASMPIQDALGDVDAVDVIVAYGVPARAEPTEIAVAAVTVRSGWALEVRDLDEALEALHPHDRPAVVHVVAEIPVSTWFRPLRAQLRTTGIPVPGAATPPAWYLDLESELYRRLTQTARRRLLGGRMLISGGPRSRT